MASRDYRGRRCHRAARQRRLRGDPEANHTERKQFAAALKEAGHDDVTYIEVPGRNHSSLVQKLAEPEDSASAAIHSFTDRHRSP